MMQFAFALSSQWCDPKFDRYTSVCIQQWHWHFVFLINRHGIPVQPPPGDNGQCYCQGHVSNYSRLCILITKFQLADETMEQSSMQPGAVQTMTATGTVAPFPVGPQLFSADQIKPIKIPAGEQCRVCMRLTMSSVFP